MCNLYSVTKGQQAIRELYRAMVDRTGNLPPLPGIFPDQMAPVVRSGAEGRELAMMRWGFPCPPSVPGNRAVTNIRNTASGYWRAWMKPENRCLVPATSFCEYAPGKPAVPHWFALGADRPLFAFAGLWRPWSGTRGTKAEPIDGTHELFAFLTCDPNAIVAPIHPKAMPVILTTAEECDAWLAAPIDEALHLQRPLADGLLAIIARGEKQDPPSGSAELPASAALKRDCLPPAVSGGYGRSLTRHGLPLNGSPCTPSTRVGRSPQCWHRSWSRTVFSIVLPPRSAAIGASGR